MSLEIRCLEPNEENIEEGDLLVVRIPRENKFGFASITKINKLGVIAVSGNNQVVSNYEDCIVLKQWKDNQEMIYLVGENSQEEFELFYNMYNLPNKQ